LRKGEREGVEVGRGGFVVGGGGCFESGVGRQGGGGCGDCLLGGGGLWVGGGENGGVVAGTERVRLGGSAEKVQGGG